MDRRVSRPRRAGVRALAFGALVLGAGGVLAPAGAAAADKAEKVETAEKGANAGKPEKNAKTDKNEKTAKPAASAGAGGAPGTEAATPSANGQSGAAPAEDGTSSKRHGPPLLRSAQTKRPAAAPPPPVKPGEDPPPPSPLTMDALRQDMKRGKDAGGISPDAPARTKVEQVLAEMVKTRAALRDDTSKLESLTLDGLSAGEAGAPGGGPAAPGAPGQPPQKNPLDVLAKALRGIKPDQAAPIVARIDRRLAATVLLKMPPVDAGKIMGALKPDVAAEIATEIAMRAKPQHPLLGMGAKR
jgi:flagellar motility protein MotE (MotC chaperone)